MGVKICKRHIDITPNGILQQFFTGTKLACGEQFDRKSNVGGLNLLGDHLQNFVRLIIDRPNSGHLERDFVGKSH